ncbi:hypothetical protein [Microbacterium sp. A93]|uniref:hypothetical protein n=1 Tax=Microbacterium sp. A93 TaxID=3450716 RepID=UPI003F43840D
MIRGAIWIAIGALIAAAIVCVVWVLVGNQDGIIGRAFLTIVLLAGFAGIAILEAGLATKRPEWLALASMITWIVALLVGAIKIWLPEAHDEYTGGVGRFFMLLLVIGVMQLALLHVRLFTPAARRYVTTFTQVIYYVTISILVLLVGMLVIYLTLPDTFEYGDLYWRIVVALAILAAVGTTLIPLLNALFAPKKHEAQAVHFAPNSFASAPVVAPGAAPVAQQWPTYADGLTPLPVLQDGSPDWNAYYTGYPTQQQAQIPAPAQSFPVAPDYSQAQPAPQVAEVPVVQEVPVVAEVPVVPEVPAAEQPAPEQPAPGQHPAPGAFPPPPPAPPQ